MSHEQAGSPIDERGSSSTQMEEFQLETTVDVPVKDQHLQQTTSLAHSLSALLVLFGLYVSVTSLAAVLGALVQTPGDDPEGFRYLRFLQFLVGLGFAGIALFGYKSTDFSVPQVRQLRLGKIFLMGAAIGVTSQVVLSVAAFILGNCDKTAGLNNPAANAIFHNAVWAVFHTGTLAYTIFARGKAISAYTLPQ